MILWINGAFGSGKTQTAFELHKRIKNSYVYDPENIGYFIRKNIPRNQLKEDFQDYTLWREFNYKMLKDITMGYDGIIIVPMTLTSPDYYHEIIDKLREDGIDVRHYILYADKQTILKRLRTRGEGMKSWAANQIDRCIDSFDYHIRDTKIDTQSKSVYEIVEEIAKLNEIQLIPDTRTRIGRILDRWHIKLRHIRV